MTTVYDGIILGAGHNGMILQAYLGKAGLRTVAIERRPLCGRWPLDPRRSSLSRAFCTIPTRSSSAPSRPCRGTPTSTSPADGATYIEPELNVVLLTQARAGTPVVDRFRAHGPIVRQFQRQRMPRRCVAGAMTSCRSSRTSWRRKDDRRRCRERNGGASWSAVPPAGACSQRANCHRWNSSNGSLSIRWSRLGCCSSTACARSICGCADLVTIFLLAGESRQRRKCRAAVRRRCPARSNPRCGRPAAKSG